MTDNTQQDFQKPDDVWLLNLGYVSEHAEQNLLLYGYISCPGVANVELMLDVDLLEMRYAIVLSKKTAKLVKMQQSLQEKQGLWGKLMLFLFLKWFGSYNPAQRVIRCVRDYAGPTWKVNVEVVDAKQYLEVINAADGSGAKGWFFKNGINTSERISNERRP
jgi:hypothetical protein